MENLKEEILKILVSEQETCKVGSDGDYSQEVCVFACDFNRVADKVASLIQAITDPENQPNQHGIYLGYKLNFEKSVEVVQKYLSENHHPHTMVEIDCSKSVLWEGVKTHVTDKFIVD